MAKLELQVEVNEYESGSVVVMDSTDNVDYTAYQNLLLLGAIAAASAFVVTILIVLVCVGCQR